MGVRVRLRLCSDVRCLETSALVNTGFESIDPELVIPAPIAQILEIHPSPSIASYTVAGGGSLTAIRGDKPVRASLVLEEGVRAEVTAVASIVPGEEEVIISDRLAHDLGIAIIDPYEGLWCLRDEIGLRVRRSVKPELWRY